MSEDKGQGRVVSCCRHSKLQPGQDMQVSWGHAGEPHLAALQAEAHIPENAA